MNVHVHIERLILDGLPVDPSQGPVVQAAAVAELSRLLTERGLAPGLQQGRALAYARGADLHLPARPSPDGLGEQIAWAVQEGLRQ